MKNAQKFYLIMALIAISLTIYSQDYHVRIGTIGNSITHGISLTDPETEAYPAQLGTKLEAIYGDTCIVENYGLTTTTMLKNGDVSYWDTQHLQDYLAHAPEICLILLGTNDTKSQNWDEYGDEFKDDYLAMIDTIKQRNPSTLFMLGYPPPAFAVEWGIRDSVIVNGVIPAIDSVLELVDADSVDFYYPLLDSAHLFPDNIHPNVEGSGVMAQMILDKIVEKDLIHKADTGLTFITSFKTETTPLALHDSTVISWTTINADSVFLNDQLVQIDGSMKISPPATTVYTLIAKGSLTNDTIQLTQEIYIPELNRLEIEPGYTASYEEDTIFFQVFYFDQLDNIMPDTSYAVQWTLLNSSGYLYGESDTSVYFVAANADTSELVVSFETLADTALIFTWASTGIYDNTNESDLKVFPNPGNDLIQVQMEAAPGKLVTLELFNLKGELQKQKIVRKEHQIINLEIDDLAEGFYILKIRYSNRMLTRKIIVSRN